MTLIADILASCEDEMVKKQMAYMLARCAARLPPPSEPRRLLARLQPP